MATAQFPSVDDIRSALVNRATEYCERNKTNFGTIGRDALHDPTFLYRLREGANFHLSTYGALMRWFDRQERRTSPTKTKINGNGHARKAKRNAHKRSRK